MKKILITGGCGFIGSHLVEAFLKEGYYVRLLDHKRRAIERNPGHPVTGQLEQIVGDICDPDSCQRACEGMDVVFHNAAISIIRESFEKAEETSQVNIQGTRNLLQACADNGVERFIFSSSGKIYGDTDQFPCSEDGRANCTSPYAQSKYEAEKACRQFSQDNDLSIVVLRYFSVYGPGQRLNDTLIGEVLLHVVDDDRSSIYALPEMKRDFTYIDDVIRANFLSLTYKESKYDVFNVGSGQSHSVEELFKLINAILGKTIEPAYRGVKEGTVIKTEVDIAKARRLLGYQPKVLLPEGLARTIEWMKLK